MKFNRLYTAISRDRFNLMTSIIPLTTAVVLIGNVQSAAAATAAVEEIIVTAQKREQNIEDVPLFMSVISAETLELSHTTNFNDLSKIVPGLSVEGPLDGTGSTIRIKRNRNDGKHRGNQTLRWYIRR